MGLQFLFAVLLFAQGAWANGFCRYDAKDYDSPGFGIPHRDGLQIKGRFGCVYRCECANGTRWKVTHVLEESHFNMNVLSNNTGGPHAAKWFICPQSVKPDTWRPGRDELGRIIYYSVDPNYDKFPSEKMMSSPQFQTWKKDSCGE